MFSPPPKPAFRLNVQWVNGPYLSGLDYSTIRISSRVSQLVQPQKEASIPEITVEEKMLTRPSSPHMRGDVPSTLRSSPKDASSRASGNPRPGRAGYFRTNHGPWTLGHHGRGDTIIPRTKWHRRQPDIEETSWWNDSRQQLLQRSC